MILGQQEASKVLPLVNDLYAYEAFLTLIDLFHKQAYEQLKTDSSYPPKEYFVGQLTLLDELKEVKLRIKDSLKNG